MQVDPFVDELQPAPAPVERLESGGYYQAVTTFVSERPWETGSVISMAVIITVQVILFIGY